MLVHGPIVPLSELSPGDWFVLMRRQYDDIPDSLEPIYSPYKLHSVNDNGSCTTYFKWGGSWHTQMMNRAQLVRRCDPNR